MAQVAAAVPGTPAGRRFESRRLARRRHEIRTAYLLLAPAALLVFGVLVFPFGWEVWVSLTNSFVERTSTVFIGLANYAAFLRDPAFWRITANTLGYLVLTTVLKLALGIGAALLLARPFPGRPLVFLAVFLPWAYPAGLAYVGWFWLLLPPLPASYANFMAALRVVADNALGPGTWGFLSLVILNVWRGGSFVAVFTLAALNGIPQDLFDYAALEVKGAWRKFWMVTVPLLRPFLALAAFLSIVSAVADLSNVWMQTGQRDIYPIVWTDAFQLAITGGMWGKGAAESLILLPVLVLILVVCFYLFEPLEEDPT